MQSHNNKGFTLIEIAIVLTIVGLIIGGIWSAASIVMSNYKTQTFMKEVIQVIQNTKRLFSSQGSSATAVNFSIQEALASGIFPSEMISSASTAANPIIVTPFSTDQTINAVTGDGRPNILATTGSVTTVSIIFGSGTQGVSGAACTKFLLTLGSLDMMQKYGIVGLWNAGHTSALTAGGTVAVTPSTAALQCNNPGNTNYPEVVFSII